MNLSTQSIEKPVQAIVFSLLILVFGVVGYFNLGVREYPEVDPPIVTVKTIYTGADPQTIQSEVTEPLEDAISGAEGIRVLSSVSSEQISRITVEFDLDEDLEAAANNVRDRVSRAIQFLPKDVDPPVVEKMDANANPIIFLTLESKTKSLLEVGNIVENQIKDRLQTIPGVGMVKLFCPKDYSMRLWLDPYKMTSCGITSVDVQNAVIRENLQLPSGRIEGENTEMNIRTLGLLEEAEEFNNLIIKQKDGSILRLSDIGYAELRAQSERTSMERSGQNVVAAGILPQRGANSIEIVDEFYKRFNQIKKELPDDYYMEVGFDFTNYERRAVSEVQETVITALILVSLIIFIFLMNWRSTIIPVIAIPVSIIGTFFIMYIAGATINVLTLMGIVLAIGLVCDDAIIVLENIYTKIDSGIMPKKAAKSGMDEIYFAVISTTITLAAVFLPLLFLGGLTGRLFREFAIVVAGAVLISAFVALTLSPMMCAYILDPKKIKKENIISRITNPFFDNLTHSYTKALTGFLRHKWLVFPVLAFIVSLIAFFITTLHSELAPLEDRSNIRIPAIAPEGSSFEFTRKYMDELDAYLRERIPEGTRFYSLVAPSLNGPDPVNKGMELIYLKDAEERERSQDEIFQDIAKDLTSISGIAAFPFQPPTIGDRFGGLPLQYVILAPTLDSLISVLPKFLDKARENKNLRFVDANLKINKPELVIEIDRDRSAQMGVSARDIASTLQASLSGQRYCYFIKEGKQYEVTGMFMRSNRNEPADLDAIFVRNTLGEMVPIDNVITAKESISPSNVFTFNRYISATVSAGMAPGATLGDGIAVMDEIAKEVLPENFRTALAGQARDFQESSTSLLWVFLLCLVLIYLVLSAQFQNFKDPFIILITVPLAMAGALFSLWYFNQSINIFSEIGIILLIGLATKNGILIVEFANQRKMELELSKTEAVTAAAAARLRPILMTASATMLGVLPIALSFGASAGSRQSLGIAVVGGMFFSTALTLFVIPAMYLYLSSNKKTEDVKRNEIFSRLKESPK